MSQTKRQKLVATLVALFVAGVAWAQYQPPAETKGQPKLVVEPLEWNFAEVWQGEVLSVDVTLKNVGDAPLVVEDVKSSCGCTAPTKPKSPIPAGESSTMQVEFDAIKRTGPQRQAVTIITNDPGRENFVFNVSGLVKPVYELQPTKSLAFGQLKQGQVEKRTIELFNRYTQDMDLQVKAGQTFDDYEIELKEVVEGRHFEITAITKPPLRVGVTQQKLVLETGIERLPEISVTLFSNVRAPLTVRPKQLFMARTAPNPLKQTLRLSYGTQPRLEVLEVKPNLDAIKVELVRERPADAAADAAGWVSKIIVTLPPGDQVPADAKPAIEIRTNAKDPAFKTLTVPVRVLGPVKTG